MVKTLYVCRHGLRANELPSPTGIDGDVRINPDGELQAAELGTYLASLRPDVLVSSPFYRCLQTLSPAAAQLELPIFIEPGFGEHYHRERPTHPIPLLTKDHIARGEFPAVSDAYAAKLFPSKDGETRDELRTRVKRALELVFAEFEAKDTLLIMTHAAVKITIGEVLVGVETRAGTASLDEFRLVNGSWQLVRNGDVSHLKGGEQMHWSFDMAFEAGSAADVASRLSTSTSSVAPTVAAASEAVAKESDTVKVYVPLDFSGEPPVRSGELSYTDLSDANPLVKVGSTVYEGEWHEIVGTEVYTDSNGEPVGTARQRIALTPVQQSGESSKQNSRRLVDRLKVIDEHRANQEESMNQEDLMED